MTLACWQPCVARRACRRAWAGGQVASNRFNSLSLAPEPVEYYFQTDSIFVFKPMVFNPFVLNPALMAWRPGGKTL
jgi:hypothetical protein